MVQHLSAGLTRKIAALCLDLASPAAPYKLRVAPSYSGSLERILSALTPRQFDETVTVGEDEEVVILSMCGWTT